MEAVKKSMSEGLEKMEAVKRIIAATIVVSFLMSVSAVYAMDSDKVELVGGTQEEVKEAVQNQDKVGVQLLNTALLKAAESGDEQRVRELLAQKADVDAQNEQGVTALLKAVNQGLAAIVDVLIAAKASVDKKFHTGITPLMCAAHYGYGEIVKALIGAGADLDLRNSVGATALMHAAVQGNADIINILLDVSARVDIGDKSGGTALIYTVSFTADEKKMGAFRALLRDGRVQEQINIKDNKGDTALAHAMGKRSIDMLPALLQAGADIDAQNNVGYTALICAASCGHDEVVDALVKAGAALDKTAYEYGNTALMCAVLNNNRGAVNILLRDARVGMHIDIRDTEGWTPLMTAVHNGRVDFVKSLIAARADVRVTSADGCTIFDRATPEMIQIILDAYGALPQQGGVLGMQRNIPDLPIMLALAVNQKNQPMVSWLLRVDPHAVDKTGSCTICMGYFAERVICGGMVLHRTNQACQHLVCEKCAQLQREAEVARDDQRNRGIYLGVQNGQERWMLPGRINLKKCPECRIEHGRTFVPREHQRIEFEQLKQEFARWCQERRDREAANPRNWAAELSARSPVVRNERAVELSVFHDYSMHEPAGVPQAVAAAAADVEDEERKDQADKSCRIL